MKRRLLNRSHTMPAARVSAIVRRALRCATALLYGGAVLLLAIPAWAQTSKPTPSPGYGLLNPFGGRSVPGIIGGLVSWLGGLAGSLFFIFLLWGGVQWMTAGGDVTKVKKAQGRIVASVAGILVVILSYIAVATIIGVVPK